MLLSPHISKTTAAVNWLMMDYILEMLFIDRGGVVVVVVMVSVTITISNIRRLKVKRRRLQMIE